MSIADQVREIIARTLGCDEVSVVESASVKDDLGADSLAVVELVMALEDTFGISVSEEKLKEITTVGDILRLVDET
jgi:acyl carrier protein